MKIILENLSERQKAKRYSSLFEGVYVAVALKCEGYINTINGVKRECTRWVLLCVAPDNLTKDGKPKEGAPMVTINVTPYRSNLYTTDNGAKGGVLTPYIPEGDFGAELHKLFLGKTPKEIAESGEKLLKGNPRLQVGVATFFDFAGEYPRQIQTLQRI